MKFKSDSESKMWFKEKKTLFFSEYGNVFLYSCDGIKWNILSPDINFKIKVIIVLTCIFISDLFVWEFLSYAMQLFIQRTKWHILS